jgi:Tol biopolymer transport system component
MRTEKALTEKARNRKAVSIMRRISSRSPRPRAWRRALADVVGAATIALLLSTPPQAFAQAQANASAQAGSPGARVMTPELVAKLRGVSSAVMSPSGTHAAYTIQVQRKPFVDEDGPAWVELHVLDLATGESRPYVSGKVNVSGVSWTPDGSAIAYLAKREGDEGRSLYAIPLAGGESVRLLEHEGGISGYSLSPDGSQVAFLSREKPDPRVKELAGKGFKAEIFEEELRYSRLWIASLAGGEPRLLDVDGHVSGVQWSPAADRLMLTVAPTPL